MKCSRTTVRIDHDGRNDNVKERRNMGDTNIVNDMDDNVIDVNEVEDNAIKTVANKYDLIELNENDVECYLELNEDEEYKNLSITVASDTDTAAHKISSKSLMTYQNNITRSRTIVKQCYCCW